MGFSMTANSVIRARLIALVEGHLIVPKTLNVIAVSKFIES